MATSTAKIYINGKEVENTLKALTAEATRLRKELANMTVGDANFEQTAKSWQQVRQEIDKQKKALNDYLEVFEDVPRVSNSIGALKDMHRQLLKELEKLEIGSEEWLKKLDKVRDVEGKLAAVNREVSALSDRKGIFEQVFAVFIGGGLLDIVEGAVGYIRDIGESSIKAASDAELLNIALETMLGSKEKAEKLKAEIIDLVAKSPLELEQANEMSKRLLAMSFTAENVVPTLKMLGDIASGVGIEKLPQLTIALGQVKAATKLTGNELRQFTEAGVPLLDEIAKQMKKPASEIQKMVSDGKIGYAQVEQALRSLTTEGGRFNNLMEKQSQTLQGQWSTLKDNFTQNVLIPIGNAFSAMIKPVIAFGSYLLENIPTIIYFSKIIAALATVIGTYVASVKLAALWTEIQTKRQAALSFVTTTWNTIVGVLTGRIAIATIAQRAWNTVLALNPYALAIAGVTALISATALFVVKMKEQISVQETFNKAQTEVTKRLIEEKAKYQDLIATLKDAKATRDQKTSAVKKLNELYPDILKKYQLEKGDLKDLTQLENELNTAIEKRIATEMRDAATSELRKQKIEMMKGIAELETIAINASREQSSGEFGDGSSQYDRIQFEVEQRQANLKKLDDKIKETGDLWNKTFKLDAEGKNKPTTTTDNGGGGGDGDANANKKADKEREALDRLKEILVQYQNDIDQLNANHDAAEALKIEEKYAKQIKAAEVLLKSKNPKVRKEAAQIIAALIQKQNDEILATGNKHYNELLLQTQKREQDIAEAKLSAEDKKISDIRQSYQKQLEEARQLEQSKLPEIAQKGAKMRLQIERDMNAEIEAQREKFRLERSMELAKQQIKDAEETKTFWEQQAKIKADFEALLKELKPENKIDEKDTIEVKIAKIKAQNDAEIAELERKVKAQRAILGDDAERVNELNKAFEAKKTEITNKGALERLKIQADELAKTLSQYAELTNNIGNAFKSLGDIIGSETEEAAALQKIAGMAKVMVDTATAISGIVSVAATTSLDPITMAIRISAGVAQVLANIATAKKLLFGAPEVKQKAGGGYSVRGKDDGRVYNANYIGARNTGMLPPTPSLVLASEKGAEYYVSAPALTRPDVSWHVRMIDNIMNNRGVSMPTVSQKAEGGYNNNVGIDSSGNDLMMLVLDVVSRLNDTLDKGIDARTTIGYEEVKAISDAQNRLSQQ